MVACKTICKWPVVHLSGYLCHYLICMHNHCNYTVLKCGTVMFAAEKYDLIYVLVMPINQSFTYNVFTLISCSLHNSHHLLSYKTHSTAFTTSLCMSFGRQRLQAPLSNSKLSVLHLQSVVYALCSQLPCINPEHFFFFKWTDLCISICYYPLFQVISGSITLTYI